MYGPYLNSISGDRALTPPKRHSLGKPLPYQLADTTQAPPKADCSFGVTTTSGITSSFDELCQTSGQVPTRYYLVRHSEHHFISEKPNRFIYSATDIEKTFGYLRRKVVLGVRLACLIHAASVHPELGSNSKK